MPIYEYLCPKCTSEFELMRLFSEAEKPVSKSEAQKVNACKTGSSIQVSPKPFRKAIPESVGKQASKGVTKEKEMGTKGRKNAKKPKKQQEKKK